MSWRILENLASLPIAKICLGGTRASRICSGGPLAQVKVVILHNYLNSWTWSTIPGCQWKIWLLTRKSILSKTTAAPSFQSYVWNSDEKPGNKIELVTVLENVVELWEFRAMNGWILSSLLKLISFTSIKKKNEGHKE